MTLSLGRSMPSVWGRLWQVPLLVAGVVLFVVGLKSLVAVKKGVGFETHVADVQQMLATKRYERALTHIDNLEGYFTAPPQQAQLALLKGDAFYQFQAEQATLVAKNYRRAMEHYREALRLGLPETAVMNERWGRAALALGENREAAGRLEKVLASDPGRVGALARPLVEAYLGVDPPRMAEALALLEKVAKLEIGGGVAGGGGVDDRVWALTKRLELTLEGDEKELERALADAKGAVEGIPERNPAGILLTWIGRAEYERGHADEAWKYLAEARGRFVGHDLDDGRAALLMGKMALARGDLPAARGFFGEVITSHAGSPLMAAAKLGRAEVAAASGEAGEAVQADYRAAIKEVKGTGVKKTPPEMISVEAVRESLVGQQQRYRQAGRLPEAVVFVGLQKELGETETPDFVLRQARIMEGRGDELLAQGRTVRQDGTEVWEKKRDELLRGSMEHYAGAADLYIKHARLVTMDALKSGESLWRGALLLDKAGRAERSAEVYLQYIRERPSDGQSRIPEALHRVGMLQQSMGKLEAAIGYYQRNATEHPKTNWAYASTVQLARCYMAQGDRGVAKAEETLLSVVQDNPYLRPEAPEFKVSLFTLGELYYRTQRWSEAILRLEEALSRYPDDAAVGRATFWVADAYRRSAGEIAAAIKKDSGIDGRDQLEQARLARLRRAAALFGQVIGMLETEAGKPGPEAGSIGAGLEEDYLRYSYLYRADCHFELGEYATAVKLYDQAATRFAQSTTAVEAYVQIINAYLALKEPAQATAAAERARWILKRLPDEAFGRGPVALSRQQYEDYLKLGGR